MTIIEQRLYLKILFFKRKKKKKTEIEQQQQKRRSSYDIVAFILWPSVSYHESKILNATQRDKAMRNKIPCSILELAGPRWETVADLSVFCQPPLPY